MATNPYFKYNVRSEQNLLEDLIIESIQMYGQDVYYIPREVVHRDMIFNDSILSRFKHAYKVETYLESVEGFEGDGDLFSKFGVEIRDAVTLIMSRRRWNTEIRQYVEEEGDTADTKNLSNNTYYRPREGDLVHLPLSGATFQIMRVEDDAPFYQLGNLPTFRLRCEKFEYSDEDFDTGIEEIDRMENFMAYQWRLTLDSAANGFTRNEIVQQTIVDSDNCKYGVELQGEVVEWLSDERHLFLAHVGADADGQFYRFETDKQVIGLSGGSVATVTGILEMQDIQAGAPGGATEMVDDWDLSALEYLDFSETNPLTR
jgi:hypothetical protein